MIAAGRAEEFRALWVDAFHPGFKSRSEVTQLIADARRGHFNALVVEVRKRGDAYYDSRLEPRATDIAAGFDPLAELIRQAHAATPRIEVHAWIVTFPIWASRNSNPPQPTHVFNRHPDWLMKNDAGETWTGSNYQLDPGHPGVQEHTFNVAMDLISRYAIDGFHWDYIRYPGREWGYNATAVERFNRRYNRTGQPARTDAIWLQWRRDQVTALVRRVYLSAIALKPALKLSAATITWAPGPVSTGDWTSTAAYSEVLQDWRGWMTEGILDLNMPMAYFDQAARPTDWARWSAFAKDARYRRQVALGTGLWINSIANSIVQFRSTRTPTARGNSADGVVGFSYAAPAANGSLSAFLDALTQTSAHDSEPVPVFADYPAVPTMPWKTNPDRGHLLGYARELLTGLAVDGATVRLSGPLNRLLTSDAHGAFGIPDLPPGEYRLSASQGMLNSPGETFTVTSGVVARQDLLLTPNEDDLFLLAVGASPGRTEAIIRWQTGEPASGWVEFGLNGMTDQTSHLPPKPTGNHDLLIDGLMPNAAYTYRVVAETGDRIYRSSPRTFHTAGELIVDNPAASFLGPWISSGSLADRYGEDYQTAATVSGSATATAVFTPPLETAGYYDVYAWHPTAPNASDQAPFEIVHAAGITRIAVDQTEPGGEWRLLTSHRPFLPGVGQVRLDNATGEPGRVVLADAIRWIYAEGPTEPAPATPPLWWSLHYFGGAVRGEDDNDADLYTNLQEYVLGTNPTDADARFLMAIAVTPEKTFEIHYWPHRAGRAYEFQATDALTPSDWQTIPTTPGPVDAHGWGVRQVEPSHQPYAARFYRLAVRLTP